MVVKKRTTEANALRESDLIATLKVYGFEVTRGDLIPILLARPKN